VQDSDYLRQDATALAALVASGEASAADLLAIARARHTRLNAALNCTTQLLPELAQRLLPPPGKSDKPLAGVPFLVKDSVADIAGVATSYGSRSMQHVLPQEDAAVTRRYQAAGLVIFGKTNLPEFGLKGVSDSAAFGRVNNPWDLSRTPGGSSGGSAAAVAAGIVPMAGGNDGGGSLRIPAACCGLFALKPGRGRVSNGPGIGEVWYGACSEGVISRSVRDSALALDILCGPQPGDPFHLPVPAEPFARAITRPPRRLRIGFSTASPIGTPVHPEAVAAVHQAAQLLQSLGHEVEEAAPDIDGAALARAFIHLYFGQIPASVGYAMAQGARRDEFELLTLVMATLGQGVGAGSLTAELIRWNGFARSLAQFHQCFDAWLSPTIAAPPPRHGEGDPAASQQALLRLLLRSGLLKLLARSGAMNSSIDQLARESLKQVPYTQLANLTGTPAMSVPLHTTADGLPLGVQFVGRGGEEALLLQLAAQLEQAAPWFDRLPALART
jgi:amidase